MTETLRYLSARVTSLEERVVKLEREVEELRSSRGETLNPYQYVYVQDTLAAIDCNEEITNEIVQRSLSEDNDWIRENVKFEPTLRPDYSAVPTPFAAQQYKLLCGRYDLDDADEIIFCANFNNLSHDGPTLEISAYSDVESGDFFSVPNNLTPGDSVWVYVVDIESASVYECGMHPRTNVNDVLLELYAAVNGHMPFVCEGYGSSAGYYPDVPKSLTMHIGERAREIAKIVSDSRSTNWFAFAHCGPDVIDQIAIMPCE
jgi:hypothetical protein